MFPTSLDIQVAKIPREQIFHIWSTFELLKLPYDSTGQTPLSETTSQKHYQHRKEEKNRKIIKFPVGPHKFSNIMQKLITDAES